MKIELISSQHHFSANTKQKSYRRASAMHIDLEILAQGLTYPDESFRVLRSLAVTIGNTNFL
jgi:hypothetical protein